MTKIAKEPRSQGQTSCERMERRKHDRHVVTQHISVGSQNGQQICDLVDISPAGARLRISNGAVPRIGTPLSITLMDGTTLHGRVTWIGQNNLGIELVSTVDDVDALLSFEDLGEAYYSAALNLQRLSRE